MTSPRLAISEAHSHDGRHREWFLRDSLWTDTVWILEPTSRLDEDHPQRIRWDFTLSDGQRFTDPPYADLLESSKWGGPTSTDDLEFGICGLGPPLQSIAPLGFAAVRPAAHAAGDLRMVFT